ncbi:outer membrane lipoprotein-sorting protein [uncultured Sunxiuqinia sp.]|uniref:outer membrane lipoprotein-sorting protein n=1 Tax=Sunxiuqinia rutila TaxID=1397841 RepID=UPI0026357D73|nr:outer membrane lipoprotein-sorting protein [uncultured Sunxiuqinia sp.]
MKKIIILLCLTFSLFSASATDTMEAKKLFEHSTQKLSLQNIRLVLDLETFDGKGNCKTKELTVSYAQFDDERKVLIELLAPENVMGTKIVTTDYPDKKGIIEIYMPATGRVQKIRANQRNLKIIGTEIPIEQFKSAIDKDFEFTFLEKTDLNDTHCQKIKIQSPEEKGYRIAFVSIDKEQLMSIEQYDIKGKLVGVTEFSNYIEVANSNAKFFPQMILVKNLKSGKSSDLKVRQVNHLSQVNSDDFILTPTQS